MDTWCSLSLAGHGCWLLTLYCLDCGRASQNIRTALRNERYDLIWPEISTSLVLALHSACLEASVRSSSSYRVRLIVLNIQQGGQLCSDSHNSKELPLCGLRGGKIVSQNPKAACRVNYWMLHVVQRAKGWLHYNTMNEDRGQWTDGDPLNRVPEQNLILLNRIRLSRQRCVQHFCFCSVQQQIWNRKKEKRIAGSFIWIGTWSLVFVHDHEIYLNKDWFHIKIIYDIWTFFFPFDTIWCRNQQTIPVNSVKDN